MNKITALMSFLKDAHIPIALMVFGITTAMHIRTHADLGPQYVNSLYAMYAFLGGHAFINRDKDAQ